MSGEELGIGLGGAYRSFYSTPSIANRFPLRGKRHRAQWLIYNLFMRKASQTVNFDLIVASAAEPDVAPMPSILQSNANGVTPCLKQHRNRDHT